ncbi:MAG TPA: hypothetical protein VJ506_12385, partial [Candidatus Limnocylindrales bacterium]|nr:hypothetical protein [Candidatus Limnocylindrales bacterium]
MRTFISIVLGLVLLAILGGIGVGVYNAGVSAGLAQAGAVGAGAAAPYVYGWGIHPFFGLGFGLLGLLFPILFLFLIFGLIRAAIGGGRRGWGHHGWDGGRGPEGWRTERERYMADLHRRFHEAEGANPGGSTAGGPGAGASGA